MNEKTILTELRKITKDRDQWQDKIDYVGSLLKEDSTKITAKTLWMLGEMGLVYPEKVKPYISEIATFMKSGENLLRERSLNALGRIGRAKFDLIEPYFENMFQLAEDECPNVRLAFIWANENIATNTPTVYENRIKVFILLLDDNNNRVRIEAPEIFRVIGKRKPEYVKAYIGKLKQLAENSTEKVVRIHSKGAIKVIESSLSIPTSKTKRRIKNKKTLKT
ncbi:armadillo-type protein [Neocallimastix lanati (nom. inval.)]|nr:armadillo-type protein [Neocallimastix sp. JGI-2020a]